jgi:hypothetical protein
VDAFEDTDVDSLAVLAYAGLYRDAEGQPVHSGLTHGDLRALYARLDPQGPWWTAFRWATLAMHVSDATACMWADAVVDEGMAASAEAVYWTWFGRLVQEARELADSPAPAGMPDS